MRGPIVRSLTSTRMIDSLGAALRRAGVRDAGRLQVPRPEDDGDERHRGRRGERRLRLRAAPAGARRLLTPGCSCSTCWRAPARRPPSWCRSSTRRSASTSTTASTSTSNPASARARSRRSRRRSRTRSAGAACSSRTQWTASASSSTAAGCWSAPPARSRCCASTRRRRTRPGQAGARSRPRARRRLALLRTTYSMVGTQHAGYLPSTTAARPKENAWLHTRRFAFL